MNEMVYHVNMTQNNPQSALLLKFSYSEIQVIWMEQMISKTAIDKHCKIFRRQNIKLNKLIFTIYS